MILPLSHTHRLRFCAGFHNAFICEPGVAAAYTVVLLMLMSVALALTFVDLRDPALSARLRNGAFALTVAFGVCPTVHFFATQHAALPWDLLATFAWSAVGMFGLYGVGFALFVLRIPERFAPGAFDLAGSSHNLWHLCVWAAGAVWCEGMRRFLATRSAMPPCGV